MMGCPLLGAGRTLTVSFPLWTGKATEREMDQTARIRMNFIKMKKKSEKHMLSTETPENSEGNYLTKNHGMAQQHPL